MINFLKTYKAILLSQLLIVYVAFVNKSPSGYIVTWGDVSQFLNLQKNLNSLNYVWSNLGTGISSTIYTYKVFYLFVSLPSRLLHISPSAQTIFYYLIYLLGSFWSFYFAAKIFFPSKELGKNVRVAAALIYVFNVYMFRNFIDTWAYSPFCFLYVLLPLIFAFTYKLFKLDKTLNPVTLSVLGVLFFLSNIPIANFPFYISLNIMLVILIILIYFIRDQQFKKIDYLKKVAIYYAIMIAATCWSVLPQLQGLLSLSKQMTAGNSFFDLKSWIIWQSVDLGNLFFFISNMSDFFFKNVWFWSILSILIFVIIFLVYSKKVGQSVLDKPKNSGFTLIFLMLMSVAMFLMNKGKGVVPSDISILIFNNPILGSLRSFDKSAIFLPFFSLMVLVVISVEKKFSRVIYLVLAINIISVMPFFIGGIQAKFSNHFVNPGDNYLNTQYSSLIKIPDDYYTLATNMNYKRDNFRFLSAPYNVINSVGWVNFPSWHLLGVDQTVQFFDQAFIQMNSPIGKWNWGEDWNKSGNGEWIVPFSGAFNVRYMIYHKDIDVAFVKQTQDKIKKLVEEKMISLAYDYPNFSVYKIPAQFILPEIYIPHSWQIVNKSLSQIPEYLEEEQPNEVKTYFLSSQNQNSLDKLQQITVSPDVTLEYKNISPVKYKVSIHNAKGETPLVLGQAFNQGWKVYLAKGHPIVGKNDVVSKLEGYKILEGNEDDQATKEDLASFIDKGIISTLGDGQEKIINHLKYRENQDEFDHTEKYSIGYVSKNIKVSIENENLNDGIFYETWFKKPISSEANHLVVNSYANDWLLDTDTICKDRSDCIKNSDGSYDFDVVIEFWPQRLFYLGLSISCVVFLGCVSCLIYCQRRKRKNNVE